jgi:SEC-C motif-containing protein
MSCPCGSGAEYSQCCEPYIKGEKHAPTPEALMRSRYSAYVKAETAYLRDSLAPEERKGFKESDVQEWAKSEWLGLEIISAKGSTVEFTAKYKTPDGKEFEHHEVSKFRKQGDRWYFVDGDHHVHEGGHGHHHHHHAPIAPIVREAPKVGRNDPCSCGSGKKFKKCCGA